VPLVELVDQAVVVHIMAVVVVLEHLDKVTLVVLM